MHNSSEGRPRGKSIKELRDALAAAGGVKMPSANTAATVKQAKHEPVLQFKETPIEVVFNKEQLAMMLTFMLSQQKEAENEVSKILIKAQTMLKVNPGAVAHFLASQLPQHTENKPN